MHVLTDSIAGTFLLSILPGLGRLYAVRPIVSAEPVVVSIKLIKQGDLK